jgi:hypothetical protein
VDTDIQLSQAIENSEAAALAYLAETVPKPV